MGAPRISAKNRLVPLDKHAEMRAMADALRVVPVDSDFYVTIRNNPKLAREIGAMLVESINRFRAAHPGEARERLPMREWKKAGYQDIAEIGGLLKLKSL